MSLCINPHCQKQQNPDDILFCQGCGSELLLQGRYRVMRQLGGGGFGVTFEVNEVRSNSPKVLKVLINNLPKAVELFQQEAQVLAQLNHPGIPQVERDGYFVYHPRDSQNPIHCLVMEKVVGMDLEKYMKNREMRPIDQTLAMEWLKELVIILQQVHSQNFFHRDIKPPNIMLRADGRLALIDFGTARAITQTYWFAQAQGGVTGINSAGYTPTEQMNNRAVPQSDFFALGRTFLYLLTGKEPTDPAVYDSYNNELGWRNFAPNISPQFADLIDSMMAHLPSQRPGNTEEILQRLTQIEQALNPPRQVTAPPTPPPVPTPPPKPVSAGMDFWLRWMLATIIGLTIGAALSGFAAYTVFLYTYPLVWGGIIYTLLVAPVGIMQWLALRRRVNQAQWWVLATAIGSGTGGAVGATVGHLLKGSSFLVYFAIVGSLVGAVLGVAIGQWLVLRRWVYKAGWWIIATIGSIVLGGAAGYVVVVTLIYALLRGVYVSSNVSFLMSWAVLGVVSGAVIGAITGRVLNWLLLRHPLQQ